MRIVIYVLVYGKSEVVPGRMDSCILVTFIRLAEIKASPIYGMSTDATEYLNMCPYAS